MLDAHFALQDQKLLGDLSQLEVFVNGSFCRAEDAKISVWDHGLLYGDGIFEGIRAYQGGVFKLNAHLERLFESAKAIGMTLPYSLKELSEITPLLQPGSPFALLLSSRPSRQFYQFFYWFQQPLNLLGIHNFQTIQLL